MAGHEGLLKNLYRAAAGEAIPTLQAFTFSGSYNYGLMKGSALLEELYRRGRKAEAEAVRLLWLGHESEQLKFGHHSRPGRAGKPGQCEQLCPLPHSEFIYAPTMLVWRGALLRGDGELAGACEANVGRCVATFQALNTGGIICAPSARAKDGEDESNNKGEGEPQWRNRAGEAILSRVTGTRRPRYSALSTTLFEEIVEISGKPLLKRLAAAPFPKLRVPVKRTAGPGGGYVAWMDPELETVKLLGRDALNGVVHLIAGKPELYYDWKPMAVPAGEPQVLGA